MINYADSKSAQNKNLKVCLTSHHNSLYDLAYTLVDINELLIISKLIENHDYDKIGDNFVVSRNATRNSQIMILCDEYEIIDIKQNCISIIISGIGVAATIIFNIVNLYLRKNEMNSNYEQKIVFSIESSEFDRVSNIIDTYNENHYDNIDLNELFRTLRANGYFLDCDEKDIYIITKSIEKPIGRMVKLVNRKKRNNY